MMLIGLTRPHETRTVDVEGHSLADLKAQLRDATPEGWELVSAPVRMVTGSTLVKATGTLEARGDMREIEADTRDSLDAKVPEGCRLLTVRSL